MMFVSTTNSNDKMSSKYLSTTVNDMPKKVIDQIPTGEDSRNDNSVPAVDVGYSEVGEEITGEAKLYDSLTNGAALTLTNKETMEELNNQLKRDLDNFINNENLNSKEDMISENFASSIMTPELLDNGINDCRIETFEIMGDFDDVVYGNDNNVEYIESVGTCSKEKTTTTTNDKVNIQTSTSSNFIDAIDVDATDTAIRDADVISIGNERSVHADGSDSASGTSDKPYKCHICDKVFSRSSSLKCHVRLHIEGPDNMLRNGGVFNNVVPTEVEDNAVLDDANDPPDPTNPYKCVFCEKSFPRKSNLKCHLQFHVTPFTSMKPDPNDIPMTDDPTEQDTTTTTNDENVMFVDNSDYDGVLHGLNEEIQTGYLNEKGTENAAQNDSNSENGLSESSKREYKCILCGKCFSRKSSLTFHYKFHPSKTKGLELKVELERNGIEKDLMENLEDNFIDINENDDTNEGTKLTNHLNEKPYHCHICEKQFARNSTLTWHLGLHDLKNEAKVRRKSTNQQESTFVSSEMDPLADAKGGSNVFANENDVHSATQNKMEFHKCELCHRVFDRSSSLKRHMLSHKSNSGNEIYLCDSAESGGKGMQGDRIAEMHKCDVCGRSFDKVIALKRHLALHSKSDELLLFTSSQLQALMDENGLYKCNLCDRTFERLKGLYRHKSSHKNKTNATSCDENDTDTEEMELEDEDENGIYKCDLCNRSFNQIERLKKHTQLHDLHCTMVTEEHENVTGSYVCNICDRTFDKVNGFRRHLANHKQQNNDSVISKMEDENQVSSFLDGEHDMYANEEDELEEEEDDEEECFEAVIGDQTFYCNTRRHQHGEDSLTLYKCDQCEKCFCTVGNVKRHIARNHKADNALESSTYDDDTDVENAEMQKNEADRPRFKCHLCTKFFTAKSSLKRHLAQHEKGKIDSATDAIGGSEFEGPLTCDICDRIFGDKIGLKRHMAYHPKAEDIPEPIKLPVHFKYITGLFKCGICEKSFNDTGTLKRHVMYHVASVEPDQQLVKKNVDSFPCKTCSQTFATKESLRKHSISHGQSKIQSAENRANVNQDGRDDSLLCKLCDRYFVNKGAWTRHYMAHERRNECLPDDAVVKAEPTELKFIDPSAVDPFTMENALQCDTCKRYFVSKRALRIHVSYHTRNLIDEAPPIFRPKLVPSADGTYDCKQCNRTFPSMKGIARHSSIHKHGRDEELPLIDGIYADLADEDDEFTQRPCEVCGRIFKNLKALAKHIFYHKKKDGIIMVNRGHIKEELEDLTHFCENCNRAFKNLKALAKHLNYCKLKLSDQSVSDAEEKSIFRNVPNNRASSIDGNGNSVKCDICDRSFGTLKELAKHSTCHTLNISSDSASMNVTENDGEHTDPLSEDLSLLNGCFSSSLNDTSLVPNPATISNHNATEETRDNSFKCDQCNKTFSLLSSLKRHSSCHAQVEKIPYNNQNVQYTCDICNQTFTRSSQLKKHIYEEHNGVELPTKSENITAGNEHACKLCDRTFSKARSLAMHKMHHRLSQRLSVTTTEIKCELESEPLSAALQQTEVMDYECVYCEKCFSVKTDLLEHVKEHKESETNDGNGITEVAEADSGTGGGGGGGGGGCSGSVKPFRCNSCDENFPDKCKLMVHIRSHRKSSHKCPICKRTFARKCHLVVHVRTHKEKDSTEVPPVKLPYKCHTCGKRFQFKSNLAIHIQFHASGKSYNCSYCDKRFNTKGFLRKHEMTHLPDKPDEHNNSEEFLDDEEESEYLDEMSEGGGYRCDQCNQVFMEKDDFERHTKDHIVNIENKCDSENAVKMENVEQEPMDQN